MLEGTLNIICQGQITIPAFSEPTSSFRTESCSKTVNETAHVFLETELRSLCQHLWMHGWNQRTFVKSSWWGPVLYIRSSHEFLSFHWLESRMSSSVTALSISLKDWIFYRNWHWPTSASTEVNDKTLSGLNSSRVRSMVQSFEKSHSIWLLKS